QELTAAYIDQPEVDSGEQNTLAVFDTLLVFSSRRDASEFVEEDNDGDNASIFTHSETGMK
ncbi:hypothetical protein Pmar_PMAR001215, partial [Perkinsus marinus ATCC 50983]